MVKDGSCENLLLAIENSLRKELPHGDYHSKSPYTKVVFGPTRGKIAGPFAASTNTSPDLSMSLLTTKLTK